MMKKQTDLFYLLLICITLALCDGAYNHGFVHTRDGQFILNDKIFNFNGFNAHWMMLAASGALTIRNSSDVVSVLQQASMNGLTVGRVWAFDDGGYFPMQISPGVYDYAHFQGLDIVITEAGKRGIRLILSLVNNDVDSGGRPQYVKWAQERGENITSVDDFYTNNLVKQFYKNNARTVLTRINNITKVAYKDDPTILAWELISRPRCETDSSGKVFQAWVSEMASFMKSIDKNHMVMVGAEGFYGPSTPEMRLENPNITFYGTDFLTNNQVEGIDFATIHAYPDEWLIGSSEKQQLDYLQSWFQSHINITSMLLKKPLVVAGFGKSLAYSSIPERNKLLEKAYDIIYNSAKDGGVLHGGLVWNLINRGMNEMKDGYQIILSDDLSTSQVVYQQSQRMNAL